MDKRGNGARGLVSAGPNRREVLSPLCFTAYPVRIGEHETNSLDHPEMAPTGQRWCQASDDTTGRRSVLERLGHRPAGHDTGGRSGF